MAQSNKEVNSILDLTDADAEVARLQHEATDSAITQYRSVNAARGTARWQSGIGLNAALLFGTGAAVLATIASAGVLAPPTMTLMYLAAKAAGIATGTSLLTLGIGQARAKTNERVYGTILDRHRLFRKRKSPAVPDGHPVSQKQLVKAA